MATAVSRRDRLRAETVQEIKERAWTQLATTGPLALSLRAIAREMGVTSSALYRYFPSREALLAALITDSFTSLADVLEAADDAARADPGAPGDRWLRVTAAHRQWALENLTAYGLVYGAHSADLECGHEPEAKDEMFRGVSVLLRVMTDGIQTGDLDPSGFDERLTEPMRAQLGVWREELGTGLDEGALSAGLLAWTTLHGALALECFAHLPDVFLPAEVLFDQNMRYVLTLLGCTGYR